MEKTEKVSIIVPAYNSSKTLKKTILSIAEGRYQNIEIIIIDDGSIDSTNQVAMDLTDKYSCIKYRYQKNSGVSSARNTGLKYASGDYITFVDSDDIVDETYISNLVSQFERDIDIVVSPMSGGGYCQEVTESTIITNDEIKEKFDKYYNSLLFNNVCGKMYKQEILGDSLFPVGVSIGEDLLFNLNLIKRVHSIKVIPYAGYNYLYNIRSKTHTFNEGDFSQYHQLMRLVIKLREQITGLVYSGEFDNEYKKNILDIFWLCAMYGTPNQIGCALSNKKIWDWINSVPSSKRYIFIYKLYRTNSVKLCYIFGRINKYRMKLVVSKL